MIIIIMIIIIIIIIIKIVVMIMIIIIHNSPLQIVLSEIQILFAQLIIGPAATEQRQIDITLSLSIVERQTGKQQFRIYQRLLVWRGRRSNPRPPDYEMAPLITEPKHEQKSWYADWNSKKHIIKNILLLIRYNLTVGPSRWNWFADIEAC